MRRHIIRTRRTLSWDMVLAFTKPMYMSKLFPSLKTGQVMRQINQRMRRCLKKLVPYRGSLIPDGKAGGYYHLSIAEVKLREREREREKPSTACVHTTIGDR